MNWSVSVENNTKILDRDQSLLYFTEVHKFGNFSHRAGFWLPLYYNLMNTCNLCNFLKKFDKISNKIIRLRKTSAANPRFWSSCVGKVHWWNAQQYTLSYQFHRRRKSCVGKVACFIQRMFGECPFLEDHPDLFLLALLVLCLAYTACYLLFCAALDLIHQFTHPGQHNRLLFTTLVLDVFWN